jgi:acetoacetyl-CoA synthetase
MSGQSVKDGDLLWVPSTRRRDRANLTHYLRWLARNKQQFHSYNDLWRWSVGDQEGFWGSLFEYLGVRTSSPYDRVLASSSMPGAEWFPGARLNYAEHALRFERGDAIAMIHSAEGSPPRTISWTELGNSVRKMAERLRALDVGPADRVVGYLPNSPEAVIAMLAVASIGAIWASCSPELGPRGVVERFSQLAPKVLYCVDGYLYGGKPFDRRSDLREILASLPSLQQVIYLRRLEPESEVPLSDHTLLWEDLLAGPDVPRETFRFHQAPFAHPLWVLFSSGTTGLPKPIMHCHGGIVLEQMKALRLHLDIHPTDRVFIFTTPGWMMWNMLVSVLLVDAVPVLYDGNAAYPDPASLWSLVERTDVSFFGASPAYVATLEKAGVRPRERFDLPRLESVLLAGSPVTAQCMSWFHRNVKSDLWVHSGSGGTDLCTGIAGGIVTQPVYAGEIQGRQLGVAAHAFNEKGQPVIDEVGEMVITRPLPSMPVGFWNDSDGSRYRDSYFNFYPGVWRHGDFFKVNLRGGCFVLGRSDATLNRHGVRIGTAEIYRSLTELTEIEDALIVNLDLPSGAFFMPLFLKLRVGITLDDELQNKVRLLLRKTYSPRHVPDKIYQVGAIPYTLTGKKMEVPVRRILMKVPAAKAADRTAMADGSALEWFVSYADSQTDYTL